MLLPDVTMLLVDDDLGAQSFTVRRRTSQWENGRMTVKTDENLTFIGIIQPTGAEQLQFFPEGERREGMITIYTKSLLHLTEGTEVSDDVTWNGEQYKVIRVDRWQDYGYCVAYAQRR